MTAENKESYGEKVVADSACDSDIVYERFHEQMIKHPDRMAITDEVRSVSWHELDELASTIAGMLPTGAKRVGVVMDHGVEMVAAILGILSRGAAYVPAEPSFPDARISFMMDDCGADCIVTQKRYAHRLTGRTLVEVEQGLEVVAPAPVAASDAAASDAAAPAASVASVIAPAESNSLAYVLYTSGSTGTPKGVAVENRNVCHYVRAFAAEFHPTVDDVMLQYSVCSFDIFVEEVFASLLNGAVLAIPSAETKKDLLATMDFIERNRVTMLSGFPYLLAQMNELPSIPSSLRLLISGGDVLRARFVDKLVERVAVYNTYGPSETTVCASYFSCNGKKPLDDGTYPIGKAVKGAGMAILDDDLNPVAPGEVGEICITGGGVTRGYINNADRQAFYFVTRDDGTRVYRSGDLGLELPDGNITFLHRKDHQVMILGRRVEPDGVQSVLCSLPQVKQGIVKAYADEQGMSYMVAYFVPGTEESKLSVLREEMAAKLPDYMIPEFFVKLSSIPLTPNGKVDAKALPVVLKEAVA